MLKGSNKNNIFFEDLKQIHLFNIIDWFEFFSKYRFIHFIFVGGSGVLINLSVTAFFAEIVFGREKYFYAYLIGLVINLIYNFILNTIFTFKTRSKHKRRFLVFIIYSLLMSFIQASLVKLIVEFFGVDFYLIVIAFVILFFSIFNFLFFKLLLFRNKK